MFVRESVMVGGRAITFETGRLAKLAAGKYWSPRRESRACHRDRDRRAPGLDFFR